MTSEPVSYDPPPETEQYMLASLRDVAARSGSAIITQEEIDLAYSMILSASLHAREIGSETWDRDNVPLGVSVIVAQAAARGFMNPEGYRSEGTDGVDVDRHTDYVRGAALTRDEQRRVKSMAQRSGFIAISASKPAHWHARSDDEPRNRTHYVPWTDQLGRKVFPFGSDEEFKGAGYWPY